MLATITHDLKTPLNTIIAMTRISLESNNVDEIQEKLKIINTNSVML